MSSTLRASCTSLPTKNVASSRASARPVVSGPRTASRRVIARVVEDKNGGADNNTPLTREKEPDQYWSPPGEKKGSNPMKDPLAIMGIVGLLLPFLILGIAVGTGVIDISVYN